MNAHFAGDRRDTFSIDLTTDGREVLADRTLHHAVDEFAALRCAYRALRPGGLCVVLEPGRGHKNKSKDMPPSHVWRVGRRVGFTRCQIVPAPQHLGKALYAHGRLTGWRAKLHAVPALRYVVVQGIMLWRKWYCGIAVLRKD